MLILFQAHARSSVAGRGVGCLPCGAGGGRREGGSLKGDCCRLSGVAALEIKGRGRDECAFQQLNRYIHRGVSRNGSYPVR